MLFRVSPVSQEDYQMNVLALHHAQYKILTNETSRSTMVSSKQGTTDLVRMHQSSTKK